MANRKKYYKLDDIGLIGTQKKKSAAQRKYEAIKTAEIFRLARKTGKVYTVKPDKS